MAKNVTGGRTATGGSKKKRLAFQFSVVEITPKRGALAAHALCKTYCMPGLKGRSEIEETIKKTLNRLRPLPK